MIDSHSHIYCEAFDGDRDEVMHRAAEAGVTHIVMPNENLESVTRLHATHEAFPHTTSMAMGLHPEDVHDDWQTVLKQMRQLFSEHHYVAVGEIGIDLYWDRTWRDAQLAALDEQLHWCKELELPFIIHCREALDEVLWVMDNFGEPLPPGVMHSFAGEPADVERVRKRGDFFFGVNGIVTFKKSNIKELLPVIGVERLLLETDAPFLAPVPKRGKRNESAFVAHTARFVAHHLAMPESELIAHCDANARQLFGI